MKMLGGGRLLSAQSFSLDVAARRDVSVPFSVYLDLGLGWMGILSVGECHRCRQVRFMC